MGWKHITARMRGDVVVVDLGAYAMGLSDEDQLPAFISGFLGKGSSRFLLNLEEVHFIDSAGLAEIVLAYTTVARRGGRLALVHVQPRIRRYLEIGKVAGIIESFDSEDEGSLSLQRA